MKEITKEEIAQGISEAAEEYVDLSLCGSQKPLCIFLGHLGSSEPPTSTIFSVMCVMEDGAFYEWDPREPDSCWNDAFDDETFQMLKQVLAELPHTFRGRYQGIPVCLWDWDCWSHKIGMIPTIARPLIGRIIEIRKQHYHY